MDRHNSLCALIIKKGAYESTTSTAWEHQLRIISRLFKALVHEKCVLAIYWYHRFGDSKKKTTTRTIMCRELTSSMQYQNKSFPVVN